MKKNRDVLPIFFAVDDGYIPFLAVSLESLIANSSLEHFYLIKILYTNISSENIEIIVVSIPCTSYNNNMPRIYPYYLCDRS